MSTKTNDTKRTKVEKPIKPETIQFVRNLIEMNPLVTEASEIMKLQDMVDFISSHFRTNSTEKVSMPHIIEACIQGLDDDGVRLYCKSAKSTPEKTEPDTTEENTTSSFDISDELFETMAGLLDISDEKRSDRMKEVVSMLIHPNSLSRATDDIIAGIKDIADNKDSDGIKNIIKLVEILKANISDIADAFKTNNTLVIVSTIGTLLAQHIADIGLQPTDDEKVVKAEKSKNEKVVKVEEAKSEEQPRRRMIDCFNFGKKRTADEIFADWQQRHPILR